MIVGILGMGAYALSLESILKHNNIKVMMWSRFDEEKEHLKKYRCNDKLLNGYKISDKTSLTSSLEEIINNSDLLIISIPAAFIEELVCDMSIFTDKNTNILIASKGIEHSGVFLSDIVKNNIRTRNIAVMSGGTFAKDIILGCPIGFSVAGTNNRIVNLVKSVFSNEYVRVQEVKSIRSIEILGSLKNVIAIGAGIIDGLDQNESTKNAFLTMATFDMQKILKIFRCNMNDVISFSGIGDLFLTCSSVSSRNYTFGKLVGQKKDYEKYSKDITVEGLYTLESIHLLLRNKRVKINTIDLIYNVVINKKDPNILLEFIKN